MLRVSLVAVAVTFGVVLGGSALAETWEESVEFVVKAPDGNSLQLQMGANMKTGTEGGAEVLDGVIVGNIGCKVSDGSRWCLVQYGGTGAYGWVVASSLEPAPLFEIGSGSGRFLTEQEMPEICIAEASKAFGGRTDQVELLAAKPESGGHVIAGTVAVKQEDEPKLLPFKCFFDKQRRYSDVRSLISDGE